MTTILLFVIYISFISLGLPDSILLIDDLDLYPIRFDSSSCDHPRSILSFFTLSPNVSFFIKFTPYL